MTLRRLAANVVLRRPDTGTSELLLEGSELPDWAAGLVGDHALTAAESDEAPSDGSDTQPAGGPPPPQSGPGSSKTRWVEYAEARGVEVADGTCRDDIIDACRESGVPVE